MAIINENKNPYSIIITKEANKDSASIGEYLEYKIKIQNLRKFELENILFKDRLPNGIKYVKDSFLVNGKKEDLNISKDGKSLSFNIKTLKISETKELRYFVIVTAQAKDEAINKAWANGENIKSNIATHRLIIKNDLMTNKGFIIGKVYNKNKDCNKTFESNSSKVCGIEGVKLYMEDGRYTITDQDGRYHFVNISSGTHVVQIDELSIKDRFKIALCNNSTRFANSGNSQFVEIYNSELKRADFCLEPLANSKFKSLLSIQIKKIDKEHLELSMQIDSTKKLYDPEVYIALPDGVSFVKGSTNIGEEAVVQNGILIVPMDKQNKSIKLKINLDYPIDDAIEAMLYYDTKISQDLHTQKITLPIVSNLKNITLVKNKATTSIIKHEKKESNGDFGWSKPTGVKTMPQWTSNKLDEYGTKEAIIWPPKEWVPSIPSTKIAVLYKKEHHIELTLNGKKISSKNYEKLFYNTKRNMRAIYYKGVDLFEGKNIIIATIKDKTNKTIQTLQREIWVESHLPATIKYLKEFSYLNADGKHTPIIAVKFLAKSGHPLRSGLIGSFEVSDEYEPYVKQNGKGVFEIDSDGIAYIKLKPTTKAGNVKLTFKLINEQKKSINVKLTPHFRDWIIVGFLKGSIGYKVLDKHSEPIKSKIETNGQIALFAKGRIKGKYLLTIAYNSKNQNRELFDKIDPNRYYLIYGDNSTQKSEAPTTKKLYIKIESENFYAMFGDIKSAFRDSEFLDYDRAFTGFKAKYEKSNFRVKAFIAKTKKIHTKEEIRGDGTNGYYYLKSKEIVQNSEIVTIQTRDRLHPSIILEKKTLTRYSDYDIDYINGKIFFKEPIYSNDKHQNPIYIVIEYDLDSLSSNTYTWGVDTNYKYKDLEIGVRIINEDTLIANSYIYGGILKYNISQNSTFYAEIAHSKNSIEGKDINANARYAELKYSDSNYTLKAWYRYKDSNFGLQNSIVNGKGKRDIGLNIKKRVNKNIDIEAEVNNQKEFNSTKNSTTTATVKVNYKDEKSTASIGLRHIKSDSSNTQVMASYSKKMLNNRLNLKLSHEQNLAKSTNSTYPTLTTLEADYKIDENSTIFGSVARSYYNETSSYKSCVGFSYKPWKDGEIKYSRSLEKGGDIDRVFDVLSIRQKYILTKHYTLTLGYEKGINHNDSRSSYDAINSLLEYKNKRENARLLIGAKSGLTKKLNIDFSYTKRKDKNQAFIVGAKSYMEWSKKSKNRNSSVSLSYVYRPNSSNIVVLNKLILKDEKKSSNEDSQHTLKLINNIHINWRANEKWELGLHYGIKYLIDKVDTYRYDSLVDILALYAQYDYTDTLSFGIQGFIVHSYDSKTFKFGMGAYAKKTVWQNAEVTLGYNIDGYKDSDFNAQANYSNKVYVNFKIKFDQNTFKKPLKKVSQ